MLIFEIEPINEEVCSLSIYVVFNFLRGGNGFSRLFWWLFRLCFPAYMHDVLWNHSLCQMKNIAEADHEARCEPTHGPGTNAQGQCQGCATS